MAHLDTLDLAAPRTASVFAGSRFPPDVISVAVRLYLRYGLSYRDVEELLAERGVTVDHVSVYRWVQRFTSEYSPSKSRPAAPLSTRGADTNRDHASTAPRTPIAAQHPCTEFLKRYRRRRRR
jgi:hypothetical protein